MNETRYILSTDINECEGINPCQQVCENTEGSYTCSCTEGFSLAPSNGTCTGTAVVVKLFPEAAI